jgi:SpoIID/LytB domain protein
MNISLQLTFNGLHRRKGAGCYIWPTKDGLREDEPMTVMNNKGKPRSLCFFILILLLICMLGSAAATDVKVMSAPLVTLSTSTNGMVRVYLSSLGNPSKLNITVDGSYSINGSSNQALTSGEKIAVNFTSSTGKLSITRNGVTTDMGSQFALRRHSTSGTNGLVISESTSNPYPGDLRFIVDKVSTGYKLYTVAYIYIEYYLYGVLPYEMGNSAHLEALKAQAIAARTYTLRAMQSRTGSIYDVVDTTNDQVYRGTPSGNANCKAAVDGTKGIVVMNGSSLTGTFYTASNGGQTEASKNIWGGSGYSYLNVKDDPFDLANPDSRKLTATVYGDAQSGSQNASLKALLNAKAASVVQNMGYSGSASVVTVTRINSITPHTPKYPDPSRLYTKMDFGLTVRTKDSSGATVEVPAAVTCEIFGDLEGMLGMSITSSDNELWTVTKSGSNFILNARRYGHGVGLSQRGAMQMGRLGYTYDQIVGFYYEGCKRVQHNFTNTILSPIVAGQDSQ